MLPFPLLRSVSFPLHRCPVITSVYYFSHDAPSQHASVIERIKRPSRGGQNLSDRYHKLEKSLRGKEAFSREIDGMTRGNSRPGERAKLPQDSVKMFAGFKIPEKPKPPEPDGM
jgi:hypothetical protein